MGIVLPAPGYLDGVRALTRDAGALLIVDETHTMSAGPGGCTQAWRLEPDIVTLGKAIGGGIPIGAYGLSDEVVDARRAVAATSTSSTPAASVGRWPATPCRSPRPGPRSPRCSPTPRSTTMIGLATTVHARASTAVIDRHRPAVVGHPARRPQRVPLRPAGAPRNGTESRRRDRRRARGLPPRLPRQPGRAADPVPQHGPDVPGDDGRRRRRPRRGVRSGSPRAGRRRAVTARRAIRVPADRRGMAGSSPAATRRDRGPRSRAG